LRQGAAKSSSLGPSQKGGIQKKGKEKSGEGQDDETRRDFFQLHHPRKERKIKGRPGRWKGKG